MSHIWNPNHPVVHVGDTASVPAILVQGLNEAGVPAVNVIPPVYQAKASTFRKALSLPRRSWAARKAIGDTHPSILHVHYATAALLHRNRRPLVVHCHGTDVRGVTGIRRRVLDHIFSGADLVLYATPDLAPNVPDSASYLPNPIDVAKFAPSSGPFDADVLIYSAATEVKGAESLIQIVTALKHRRPELWITAIDWGERSQELRGAGANLIPKLAEVDLPALLGRHRVVVGQQRLRALGMSELQAMSCSRPVVGVVDGGLYEDPPPVVAAEDPNDAADEVLQLLDDPARADALGKAAREWVARHHSLERVTERLVGMYGRIQP